MHEPHVRQSPVAWKFQGATSSAFSLKVYASQKFKAKLPDIVKLELLHGQTGAQTGAQTPFVLRDALAAAVCVCVS